jgi:hydroxyacyl-ACP dehydratase HTD2-like protein with hotdog domain
VSARPARSSWSFTDGWTPTRTQLLRFSGLTWNSHLIHVSREHARAYGLDDVVVHAQLHACVLTRITLAALGAGWRLRRFAWRNLAPAYVDQPLRVAGTVSAPGPGTAEVALSQTRPDGLVCVAATLTAVAATGAGEGTEKGVRDV